MASVLFNRTRVRASRELRHGAPAWLPNGARHHFYLLHWPTLLEYNAYMKKRHTIQYTIRSLPNNLDKHLRHRAQSSGKSLNEVVLDALKRDAGLSGETIRHHDLDGLIGTWKDDPEMLAALVEQDKIDKDLWK